MKIIPIVALAGFAGLAGCMSMEPVVADYNGHSVKIQAPGLEPSSPPSPAEDAKAQEVCGAAGKTAKYASARLISDATKEYLYLCI